MQKPCILTLYHNNERYDQSGPQERGYPYKKSRPLESSVFQMRLSCRPHPYMTLAVGGMLIHTTENLASNHILHTSGLEMLGPI